MSASPMGEAESAIALAATATAVAASPMAEVWQHLDVGAPVNVIIWTVIGAAAGVWNKRFKHKGNLIGAFLASFCLTLGLIVWGPSLFGWQWDNAGMQAAAGLVLAFLSQNWGPQLLRGLDEVDAVHVLRTTIASWIKPRSGNDDRP